ncbi:MAG: hypothetical protein JKP98_00885 [Rhodobacteraceae bacterium]|jgi:hypothetical protein|nr:hypothetical protein [Paracoccaceae bacterium]
MTPTVGHRLRHRAATGIERGLAGGVTVAIVVAVSLFFFQVRAAMRFEDTLQLAGQLVSEIRTAHRSGGVGMPEAAGMAAFLKVSRAVPTNATYDGDDPTCAAAAPWGGCIALTSRVAGDAEYITFTFGDIPRRICRRLMTIGPNGANALPGEAVAAETLARTDILPRAASLPVDADAAQALCANVESATIELVWRY